MTTFDDREKAFQAEFEHDQELAFRIRNRRNRLLGLWAGELMGLKGEALEAYARAAVLAGVEHGRDTDVYGKVHADLIALGVDLSNHRLQKKMDALTALAAEQVKTGI
jgi:hypothetical protein